jgi:hypothetical protein
MNFDVDAGIIGLTHIDNCDIGNVHDRDNCYVVDVREYIDFSFYNGIFNFCIDGHIYDIDTKNCYDSNAYDSFNEDNDIGDYSLYNTDDDDENNDYKYDEI